MKRYRLTVGPPLDCQETIMDHFSGVRLIAPAAVFHRRPCHSHYVMTTIATVLQNALLHAFLYNSSSV